MKPRFSLLALLWLVATSCNSKLQPDYISFQTGIPFQLRIDESARMDGGDLTLTLTGITEDSRCPKDVTCIWEGQVRLFLNAASANLKESLEFKCENSKIGTCALNFEGYSISLSDVTPYPESSDKIEKEAYLVEFVVEN